MTAVLNAAVAGGGTAGDAATGTAASGAAGGRADPRTLVFQSSTCAATGDEVAAEEAVTAVVLVGGCTALDPIGA